MEAKGTNFFSFLGERQWVIDYLCIVVVGSGIALAESVAKRIGKGAHLSIFKTYGTAQVKRGELELEFVGARRESYTHDSRNPIVEDAPRKCNIRDMLLLRA